MYLVLVVISNKLITNDKERGNFAPLFYFHYSISSVITLHHDIDNLAWNDNHFLWSGAVQLFGGQLVRHD